MKSFKSFYISESLSPVVYHFTQLDNALSILKDKQFELSASFGSDDDKFPHRYYLSVAYAIKERNQKNVLFVMDGKKFNEKYKGEPYVYWSGFWTKSANPNDEAEERILSNEPYIKMEDPYDYIKEIHILLGNYQKYDDVKDLEYWSKEYQDWERWYEKAQKPVHRLEKIASLFQIPVFIYDNEKFYLQRNKAKAVESNKKEVTDYYSKEYNTTSMQLLKLLKKIDKDVPISKEEWHNRPRRIFAYPDEMRTAFDGYLGNYNRVKYSETYGLDREITHTIISIMRKKKLKNVNEFIKFLDDMIKKAYKD
jgi:hypothetical protein